MNAEQTNREFRFYTLKTRRGQILITAGETRGKETTMKATTPKGSNTNRKHKLRNGLLSSEPNDEWSRRWREGTMIVVLKPGP
jgi:hypothetical protein